MISALLLTALILTSPKGSQLFPVKSAVVLPPGPTVVLNMPAGFDWSRWEVQLEACYDLQYDHWMFVAVVSQNVPIIVPDNDWHRWYRLRALKVSTKL